MKIYRTLALTAALALIMSAAAAQQDIQTSPPSTMAPTTTPSVTTPTMPTTPPVTTPSPATPPAQPPMGKPKAEWPPMATTPGAAPQAKEGMGCPMCKMGAGGEPGRMMEMHMRQAGLPEETIIRAQTLMNAAIHPADPQSLLAMKEQLSLTDDQVATLEDIIDSSQERALGVLDSNQWAKVRELKPQAMSMVEMHQDIMPVMMRAMGQMRPAPQAQTPYGRPESGTAQPQSPECPMKPGCR